MKRREFIAVLGGAVAALPAGAFAQRSAGRPLVGVLTPQSLAGSSRNIAAMRAGLRDAGFVEGQSVWLEFRYADGEIARLAALAAELVALNPDVIFAGSAPALIATANATKTIPVVMNTFVDPIALGVVKDLAKPGGNVTGIFTGGGTDALTGKRLSLLKQVVPNLSRVGVMIASGDATDAIMLPSVAGRDQCARAYLSGVRGWRAQPNSIALSRRQRATVCRVCLSIKIRISLVAEWRSQLLRLVLGCRRSMVFVSMLRSAA